MDSLTFRNQLLARQILLGEQLAELLVQAQEDLYEVLPELETEDERREAAALVQEMPQSLASYLKPRSRARMLAEQAISKALPGAIGIDQKLAGIESARKRVWELAETAGEEANEIRWMTRGFDCTERDLRDDEVPWAHENVSMYQPTLEESLTRRLWATADPYRLPVPTEGTPAPADVPTLTSAHSETRSVEPPKPPPE
ncbi:hypothetical protein [Kribbella sp. NPDC051770]|uniref:hypothetical protein n=1 Tax=Kribbella sp. NPDC051770 TaxID=3155413 RepID=UPI00341C1C04